MEGLACSCLIALNRLHIALRVLVEIVAVPLLEDPYEAIRQAYLVETDTESEPFDDLRTESPESPHVVASLISFPDSTPPIGYVEESEGSSTSSAGSTSSDSTTPLSPDHPLTRDTPVLVPSLRRTARIARFRSSYESSPSPSPTLLVRKRYRGTSELILGTDSEGDELGDEKVSLDSDSGSEDAKDEGPAAGDEDPGLDDKGYGLDDESHGINDEGHSVESDGLDLEEEDEAVPEDPEDGTVYIDVPTSPPSVQPVQTPPSPDWTPSSLPISPSHSNVPSPVSLPLISLTVPSPVATPTATILVDEDQFIEIDRDVRELYTRSRAVKDEIFFQRYRLRSLEQDQERAVITFRALWRPVLALETWAEHVDTRMANMSRAGYDDHRLVHDLLVQQTSLQHELQEIRGRVTALEQERDRGEQ
ncbi:hypothetical protein Tco_0895910 [Tanacetum coccineum]|uniref:Uncharacterized protein n=1 Tax=Tanacetum coccineum TaxID=301880 RepID=A0ABQ5CH05_9ASTR